MAAPSKQRWKQGSLDDFFKKQRIDRFGELPGMSIDFEVAGEN
jgi:hypothetical protein